MNIIEKIRQEIERRITDNTFGAKLELIDILAWLDTLESEKPVPKDLEEAAGEYEKKHTYQQYDGGGLTPEYDATLADAFIAGAKWDRIQMMQEAVEGELEYNYDENGRAYYSIRPTWITGKIGDKVRVLIIKE